MHRIILPLLAAVLLLAAASGASAAEAQERRLETGSVRILDLGAIRVHAYATGDPMSDECFLLETENALVALEAPGFARNFSAWKAYIAEVGKPLTDVLLSSHPGGGTWYGSARTHATVRARAAMSEGGSIRRTTEFMASRLGPEFTSELSPIDSELPYGAVTVGGIDMEILPNGDAYDILIPSVGLLYTHMLGGDSHSILSGPEQMASIPVTLEGYLARGVKVFLSSHHEPETAADAEAKIAYVRKVREIAARTADKAAFVAAVREAFPNLKGGHYLDMTAELLFGKDGTPAPDEAALKEVFPGRGRAEGGMGGMMRLMRGRGGADGDAEKKPGE